MVILALVFLTLTIGSGVNKSLKEGNKMMGKEMAPEVGNIIEKYGSNTVNRIKVYGEIARMDLKYKLHNDYNKLVSATKGIDRNEMKHYFNYAREKFSDFHNKMEQVFISAREKVLAKKNNAQQ